MWLAPHSRAISLNFTCRSWERGRPRPPRFDKRRSAENKQAGTPALPGLDAVLPAPAVSQPLSFGERLARDFAVVKMNLARRQDLISLVTFACDQDYVSWSRL